MSAHFTTPTDELLLLAETLGEVKTKADKLEAEFATQARPLEAATNALSAALSGIKALQFHVLDNNLGALSARVEEMRKAVDEQVGVIALELKKADETNAAKAGQEAEALRSQIAALQAQLGTLGAQFSAQLERVEFSAKEEAKKLQLIPGPAGAAGASLNPRGTFIDGETYNRLDVVSWLGSSYIAAVDGVTEKPSRNSNQWQVLASRGGGSAGGAADFGSLAGVAQINQGGTGQTTRAAGLNALLPDQTGATQYMLLTDGAGNVSWGAQPVAGLPSQTSNSGKLLTTNGTSASWSNAVTVSGSNATVTGTLTVNGGSADLGTGHGVKLYVNNAGAWANKELLVTGYDVLDYTQIKVPGNASNTASIKLNQNGLATFSGNILVSGTTASTTTSTGALVVGNGTSGGLGVGGSITAGDNITSVNPQGRIQINGTGNTTGVKTFTLLRSDGADSFDIGLTGTAYNGALSAGGLGNQESFLYNSSATAFRIFIGTASTNRFDFTSSQFKINPTTISNSTSSGALVVSGGVGVAGAINVGGAAVFGGDSSNGNYLSYNTDISGFCGLWMRQSTKSATNYVLASNGTSGTLVNSTGASLFLRVENTTALEINTSRNVLIPTTTASTSTSSGALVVSGGVGVGGNLSIGGDVLIDKSAIEVLLKRGANTNDGLIKFQTGIFGDFGIGHRGTSDSDLHIYNYGTAADALKIAKNDSLATFAAAIRTAAPSGGTAANWKLGTVATVSPTSPNRTIEVDIGGTIYYIHAKTTNN